MLFNSYAFIFAFLPVALAGFHCFTNLADARPRFGSLSCRWSFTAGGTRSSLSFADVGRVNYIASEVIFAAGRSAEATDGLPGWLRSPLI